MRSNNIKTDIERKIEKRIKYMDYDFNDYGKVRKEREANKISNGVFFVLFMILAIFLIVSGIFILPYGWILIVGGIFVFIWGLLLTFM
jgi:Flp pilus assembly protein TadB